MRSARMLYGFIALFALLSTGAGGAQAAAAARVWVEVTPGTITAGSVVSVRADCGDNNNTVPVTSEAFGTITLTPVNSNLAAKIEVPATTAEGGYDVTLACRTGATATTTLWVLNTVGAESAVRAESTVGPATGGGFLAREDRTPEPNRWPLIGAAALAVALAAVAVAIRPVRRGRRLPRTR